MTENCIIQKVIWVTETRGTDIYLACHLPVPLILNHNLSWPWEGKVLAILFVLFIKYLQADTPQWIFNGDAGHWGIPTCSAPPGGELRHLVPPLLLKVVALHAADGLGGLASNHNHHLNGQKGIRESTPSAALHQLLLTSHEGVGISGERLCDHLRAAGRSPHACACRLHQSPLVGRQQVVLHGLDEVVFTRAAVLYQRLLLHPLKTQTGRGETHSVELQQSHAPLNDQKVASLSVLFCTFISLLDGNWYSLDTL